MGLFLDVLAYAGAIWSAFVYCVQSIGAWQLFRYYSSLPTPPITPSLKREDVPHITVIRPVKGLEPRLYECLSSTFKQAYPKDKMSIRLCISSKEDPGYPVVKQVADEFKNTFDVQILIEAEDPCLHGSDGDVDSLGPNPKIRNISRAYREAKGDLIWIVDCNIWTSKGTAGRMVDKLTGITPSGAKTRPFKFVHQLPISIDVTPPESSSIMGTGGGRLDEMFMATSHGKFYSAINTVGVAPCICGKSNMFRKSHIDRITDPAQNPILSRPGAPRGPRGIDFFSSYICEDHLIGDLLWRSHIPGHGNHALVFGDPALQPLERNTVRSYIARRVRWLRVRKWTVILATLVEPGVESLLCCLALALSCTSAPWAGPDWFIPRTWSAALFLWVASIGIWAALDRQIYRRLVACRSVAADEDTPDFARGAGRPGGLPPQSLGSWLLAWLGRELLALPIWTRAVLLGTTVKWRGKKFRVRMDMSVVRIPDAVNVDEAAQQLIPNGSAGRKPRRD